MKYRVIFLNFVIVLNFSVIALAKLRRDAVPCQPEKCKLPKCRCYNTPPPIDETKIPQIVIISTDDALTELNYNNLYKPLYVGRKNPNGCQIGVTFFVPHDYTNYNIVHSLYATGFEIGVNSISKSSLLDYWKDAKEKLLIDEFKGQKQILAKFGKINATLIRGVRTPLLQLNGDVTFKAYRKSSLLYDNSWSTRNYREWAYTLDYLSEQHCDIGKCPKQPHKGFWVLPVNDWIDLAGYPCATIQGCIFKPNDTVKEIYTWIKNNFYRVYENERIPFNVIANAGLFSENFKAAYIKFLDHLTSLKDVYIVNEYSVIEWLRNPLLLGDENLFPCNKVYTHENSKAKSCYLKTEEEEEDRTMVIYDSVCPKNYPWVGNPLGE